MHLYIYICYWPWLYIGRGYIVLEHSTHLVWTRRSRWKFLVTEICFPQKHLPGVLNISKKIFPTKFFFQKCSWGSETHAFGGGGGGILGCRVGSENDTLLPMTMTCDRLKFWSGPAWRSKVIIQKPWRRKNNKKKKAEAGNA